MSILRHLQVHPAERDLDWLRSAVAVAIRLEHATIPPYLCALWSIKSGDGPVYDRLESVVLDEMVHMGLACNLLTTLGGAPDLRTSMPRYPGPLPGDVHPGLQVGLSGLTRELVENVFMQIEYPESLAQPIAKGYPTIGDFYDAVLAQFRKLPATQITGQRQVTAMGSRVFPIHALADVERAIDTIKLQGEGSADSPDAAPGQLAHYYRFAEIVRAKEYVQKDSKWVFGGADITFPDCWPMAPIPDAGYPEAHDFDIAYMKLLTALEGAWKAGGSIGAALALMNDLGDQAQALMKQGLGPDFRSV
jgi:hypothetical protein